MNTFTQALSNVFQTALRLVMWLGAGLLALTVMAMIFMAMLLAGLWALLTGRRTWWTQLQQARQMRAMFQRAQASRGAAGGFAGDFAGGFAGFGRAEAGHPSDAASSAQPANARPFTRRRFARVDVSDVQPRNPAH